eukprot:Seg318.26 transcript_id=Seg318.26/GoldUCD/mRNA.D3Y31 product="Cysteine-rich DPF motif domain-containing protein 1" protein_id=Seg318.26/GoldUCD/D3Y31
MEETEEESRIFDCILCGFSCRYGSYGARFLSKSAGQIMLKEDAFLLEDPFTANKQIPIVIGGICCSCKINVCVGQSCSYYYAQRYCGPCILSNLDKFPLEVQDEVKKRFKKLEK